MEARQVKAVIEGVLPVLLEHVGKAIDERFSSLEIPQGEKGDTGEKGEQGEPGGRGEKGEPGESVPESVVLEMVKEAVSQIEIPKPQDGKDALELDLVRLDEEKSYPPKTWAQYRGGIWRSHSQTEGMKGWECILAGHASTRVERPDLRTAKVIHTDSKGVETVEEHKYPGMLYRGQYKEGETYEAGDVVTRGGCAWHCNVDNPDGLPGNTKDWTLMVKKGRDLR